MKTNTKNESTKLNNNESLDSILNNLNINYSDLIFIEFDNFKKISNQKGDDLDIYKFYLNERNFYINKINSYIQKQLIVHKEKKKKNDYSLLIEKKYKEILEDLKYESKLELIEKKLDYKKQNKDKLQKSLREKYKKNIELLKYDIMSKKNFRQSNIINKLNYNINFINNKEKILDDNLKKIEYENNQKIINKKEDLNNKINLSKFKRDDISNNLLNIQKNIQSKLKKDEYKAKIVINNKYDKIKNNIKLYNQRMKDSQIKNIDIHNNNFLNKQSEIKNNLEIKLSKSHNLNVKHKQVIKEKTKSFLNQIIIIKERKKIIDANKSNIRKNHSHIHSQRNFQAEENYKKYYEENLLNINDRIQKYYNNKQEAENFKKLKDFEFLKNCQNIKEKYNKQNKHLKKYLMQKNEIINNSKIQFNNKFLNLNSKRKLMENGLNLIQYSIKSNEILKKNKYKFLKKIKSNRKSNARSYHLKNQTNKDKLLKLLENQSAKNLMKINMY